MFEELRRVRNRRYAFVSADASRPDLKVVGIEKSVIVPSMMIGD
jgi:hypothetical protein